MKLHSLATAALTALAATFAQADSFTLVGNVSLTDPVFNRPFTLTSLSGSGTAVHYDAFTFGGVSAGSYDFRMIGNPTTFDTFLVLYAGGFNPASPLTNLVALNDDFVSGNTASGSGFTFTLAATTVYTLVSTAFSNSGVGGYTTTVLPSPVPEPASYGLMALGLIGVGVTARRRMLRG